MHWGLCNRHRGRARTAETRRKMGPSGLEMEQDKRLLVQGFPATEKRDLRKIIIIIDSSLYGVLPRYQARCGALHLLALGGPQYVHEVGVISVIMEMASDCPSHRRSLDLNTCRLIFQSTLHPAVLHCSGLSALPGQVDPGNKCLKMTIQPIRMAARQ